MIAVQPRFDQACQEHLRPRLSGKAHIQLQENAKYDTAYLSRQTAKESGCAAAYISAQCLLENRRHR